MAGEESSCATLKSKKDIGTYNLEASYLLSSHTSDMDQSVVDFASLDYVLILGLVRLSCF